MTDTQQSIESYLKQIDRSLNLFESVLNEFNNETLRHNFYQKNNLLIASIDKRINCFSIKIKAQSSQDTLYNFYEKCVDAIRNKILIIFDDMVYNYAPIYIVEEIYDCQIFGKIDRMIDELNISSQAQKKDVASGVVSLFLTLKGHKVPSIKDENSYPMHYIIINLILIRLEIQQALESSLSPFDITNYTKLTRKKKLGFQFKKHFDFNLAERPHSLNIDNVNKAGLIIPSILNNEVSNDHKNVSFTTEKKISDFTKSSPPSFIYKYLATHPNNLTDCYEDLVYYHFLKKETTSIYTFRKVFSGEQIKTPIVWEGANCDLYYFIKLIHDEIKVVEKHNNKQWQIVLKCFVDSDKNPYDITKLRKLKGGSKAKKLEEIVRLLKVEKK